MTHLRTHALVGVLLTGACKDSTAPPAGAASVSVSPPGVTLSAGHVAQLTAMERNARGDSFPAATFLWTSSDTSIVSVSTAGLATARRPGIATVTAHATTSSLTGTAIVTVVPAVGQVWIPWPTDTIAVGDTAYFYAVVYDTAGTQLSDRVQVWSEPVPSAGG